MFAELSSAHPIQFNQSILIRRIMSFANVSFITNIAVEELVREWAPLVWLAPNEKFMPGDVTEFLQHVHAEKVKQRTSEEDLQIDDQEQLYYYDIDNEFSTLLAPEPPNQWERRHKRMYKDNYLYNYIIDLPIGEHSSNWFLVTNDNIGRLQIAFTLNIDFSCFDLFFQMIY